MIDADSSLPKRLRRTLRVAAARLRRWRWLLVFAGVILAVALVWSLTPARELVDRHALGSMLEAIRSSSLGIPGVALAFVLLAAVGFPVTLLIASIGAMFEFWWAVPIALVAAICAAFLDFWLGRHIPLSTGRIVSSARLGPIARRVAGRGVLTVAVLRNLPIAPFAVINIACGTTSIAWWTFLAGTIIGMLPGIVLLSLFGHEVGSLIADPTPGGVAKVVGVAALVIGAAVGSDAALRRWVRHPDPEDETAEREV